MSQITDDYRLTSCFFSHNLSPPLPGASLIMRHGWQVAGSDGSMSYWKDTSATQCSFSDWNSNKTATQQFTPLSLTQLSVHFSSKNNKLSNYRHSHSPFICLHILPLPIHINKQYHRTWVIALKCNTTNSVDLSSLTAVEKVRRFVNAVHFTNLTKPK